MAEIQIFSHIFSFPLACQGSGTDWCTQWCGITICHISPVQVTQERDQSHFKSPAGEHLHPWGTATTFWHLWRERLLWFCCCVNDTGGTKHNSLYLWQILLWQMSSDLLCSGARCLNLWMQMHFYQTWKGMLYCCPSMRPLGQSSWVSPENSSCGSILKVFKRKENMRSCRAFSKTIPMVQTKECSSDNIYIKLKTAARKEFLTWLFRGSHFHSFWLGVGYDSFTGISHLLVSKEKFHGTGHNSANISSFSQ